GTSMIYILLAASIIAILPISGPNIIILTMFATGMVPFSVLLANSLIQDGHGLLPILGYSVSDALKIKLFNFIFGLTIGLILLLLGF
ncbi:MAG: selenocysteine protein, partial [Candidatus Aenigmarchaeota archaeon]|nr:selenocysteine protein [Candidatus Aenigmarchaeota archaeon]